MHSLPLHLNSSSPHGAVVVDVVGTVVVGTVVFDPSSRLWTVFLLEFYFQHNSLCIEILHASRTEDYVVQCQVTLDHFGVGVQVQLGIEHKLEQVSKV